MAGKCELCIRALHMRVHWCFVGARGNRACACVQRAQLEPILQAGVSACDGNNVNIMQHNTMLESPSPKRSAPPFCWMTDNFRETWSFNSC